MTCKTKTCYISIRSNETSNVIGPVILTASLNGSDGYFRVSSYRRKIFEELVRSCFSKSALSCSLLCNLWTETDEIANKTVSVGKWKMEGIDFLSRILKGQVLGI